MMGRTLRSSGLACLILLLLFETGPAHASENVEKDTKDAYYRRVRVTTEPTTDCDHSVADILFILDSSISISDSDMTKMFKFVASVVESLDVGPYTTHVAVTLFASTVKEEFHLNKYYDKSTLIAAILRISRLSGFTETADALTSARTISFQYSHGDRKNVQNIIILITDGTSSNRLATLHQAQQLQKLGVVIFAIGVGGNADRDELSNIATDPNDWHVFNLDTYTKLGSIKNELASKICKVPVSIEPTTGRYYPSTRKDCNLPVADILFVLDSSGSVSSTNFRRLLKFVADVVEVFDIGENAVRVAVSLFASKTIEQIHLNGFYDKAALRNAIHNTHRITGTTNTADALLKARTVSLQPEHGDRPDVPNIVIVVTDGKSNNPEKTAQQADQLRKTGAVVFSVGVGHAANTNELMAIATGPGTTHVFQVTNFKGLKYLKDELATKACEAEKPVTTIPALTTSPANCNLPTGDILFVLDSSGSVSTPNFRRLLKFVEGMVEEFAIGENTVRVAITLFASRTLEQIHLNQYYDKAALKNAIHNINRITGTTNTADALLRARTVSLQPEHGDRPDVPNIVIVVTDGRSNNGVKTARAADQLRKTGAVVFSVGVGQAANTHELMAIATGPGTSHVFQVDNFKGLKNLKDELATKACEAEKNASPLPALTTLPPTTTKKPTTQAPTTLPPTTTLKPTTRTQILTTLPTPINCNLPTGDILFVLDSSGSVSSQNFNKLLKFVVDLVEVFNIGENTVRVAVTLFASKAIEQIHLNEYYDKAALKNAIHNINRITGTTNTGDALLRARTVSLQPEHGDRPDVPNIVIVITDGNSQNRVKTAQQADQLRKTGTVIFSVGVGQAVDTNELKAIANGPGTSHVFQVNNFKGLKNLKDELATKTCETTCNKTVADIVFALDTSASVSPAELKMMLVFVQQIIKVFDVGEENVRVGLVTFSGKAHMQFHLNKYFDVKQLLDAILHIKYERGSTNTAAALRYIHTTSFLKQNGNRDDAPNVVIVITDGKSNVPVSTAVEAARLKRISTVFSIGVGIHNGYRELKAIATDERHVFTVDNFAALAEIKHSLAIKACDAGKEKKDYTKCPEMVDIVFILDSSQSIGEKNFQKIQKFVKSISKHFSVNPGGVQIGVDTFDSVSRTEFNMNQYKDLGSLLDAISKIPVHSGQSHTGQALKRLREQSMTAAAGARPGVTHIGILITDGHPNGPLDAVAEAKKVKEAGIKLFALGIGPAVNYAQLGEIANQPASKFVFKAENFDSMETIEPYLAQEACKVAPVKEDIVCTLSADIVFVVDSSGSVGNKKFKMVLSFVDSMVNKFQIGPQAIQVGLLRYNSRNYLEFNLNKYRTKTELQKAIKKVHYTIGLTATGSAISFMHYHMFARASGFREGVPKIAIVITDGKSQNARITHDEAIAAKKDNITMFAIGIGSKVNNVELDSIASQPLDIHKYSIKDFLALESIVSSLAKKTCKVIPKDSKPKTCRDKIPRCHEFKPEVCTNYPRWSRDFCPEYCKMCFTLTDCIDLSPTCHTLKEKHCAEYPAWSRENCAEFCGFCGNKGNKTEIGDEVYACSYKGKKYQTGESWKDGCKYECSCLDSQRGMYTCWDRCPVYYNLPPQCKLVDVDGECCKKPICELNGKITRTVGHKRGKHFGVDVCIYNGNKYYEGQSWSVGCVANCICENAKSGFYSCTSRCPHYDNLPSNCHLVHKVGQCCQEVTCEFKTDFGRLKGHGEVVKKAKPDQSVLCVDKRPCEELSPSICHAKDLEFWVKENCARFCNKCPTPSVPTEGACLVNGKVYKVGETWKPSCSETCMCEDGHHGIARCFNECLELPNLPSSCLKIRGGCCERIQCENGDLTNSKKVNNTIGGIIVGNRSLSKIQNGCMYKGSYYEENQMWIDGCELVCQCFNGDLGLYKCSRRCPTFKNLPPSCHLESFPGEPCCQTPVCNADTSHILIPTRGKGLIGSGRVADPVKEGCIYKNSTYQEGEDWIDDCKYFCKCVDGKRGSYVCNERCEKLGYVPDNCRIQNDPNDDCCEMVVCDDVALKPEIQTTPAVVGKCYYRGQTYNQGEIWNDECSLRCVCEDAQSGFYRCTDRCSSFSGLPADCTPVPDPKDPGCCQVYKCGKNDLPHGLIGSKHGFGKSFQPDTKYKDKCVYKGKVYKQGETWEDGCEEACECLNAAEGRYRCHSRCEHYYSLPANCQLIKPEGNRCCPTLNCTKSYKECKDTDEMCGELGTLACTGEYEDFGKTNCPKTCGLCKPMETEVKIATPELPDDCKDIADGCANFEVNVCSEALFSFAVINCRRFCNYCDRELSAST